MEDFRKKFIEEAQEYLNELENTLLELESNSEDKSLIEKVFRVMHSLKGGGAMFGFEEISNFTHHMESVYDEVRRGEKKLSRDLFNITLESVDHLRNLLKYDELPPDIALTHAKLQEQIIGITKHDEKSGRNVSTSDRKKDNSEKTYLIHFKPDENILDNGNNPLFLVDELASFGEALIIAKFDNVPLLENFDASKCYMEWYVLSSGTHTQAELNEVFLFVEDNCELKIDFVANQNLVADEGFTTKLWQIYEKNKILTLDLLHEELESTRVHHQNTSQNSKVAERNISSIRVSTEKLDNVMNLVSELVTTQARLTLFSTQNEHPELVAIAENIQKLSRELRDNAFSIMLIPLESVLTRFHRLVRDLNTELNKNVRFVVEGAETELDKTIIENLTDPLLHIIRNSMDHGIEPTPERIKAGKPEQGTIRMKAFYSGSNVHIEVSDDGRGIDIEKIRQKAVEMKILMEDTAVSDTDLLNLIFMSGFSTAKSVSDISGRGVGMDVVKKKISEIRGDVYIDSKVGIGTMITIKLPLTLSIIDGLLVMVGDTNYILPLSSVLMINAVANSKLSKSYTNSIALDREQIPYFDLRTEFEEGDINYNGYQMIIVNYSDKKVGLVVDSIIGEYQAVLKPLGKYYEAQDFFSGASILGDGTIALVMDTDKAISFFDMQNNKTFQLK